MKMVETVAGMIGGGGGAGGSGAGLQGLVEKFQAGGLGDVAASWIGTGDNKAISADQVRGALGDDEVQRVADEAGVSKDEAASGLAALLPELVDKVTPDGLVPDAGALAERLQKLL
ncbi:MAG: DUF937 domain-containing protein [Thermoleophilia bacterium]|nr:DUF937 domain-containing protein [Thermoleophilia bacterium]